MFVLFSILISCTSKESNRNNCDLFDHADKQMLDLYTAIETKYQGQAEFLSKLSMSQVYWIQYRDRHLDALYPKKRKAYKNEDWSKFTDCECQEMVRLTKERIETLNMWMTSQRDYADCPTSIQ